MNLALVQLTPTERGRSACLQQALHAIDEAADFDPTPDLVVLPGHAATGGAMPGKSWTRAMTDITVEALCGKVREWGVYASAGVAVRAHERVTGAVILIDPSGDVVTWCENEKLGLPHAYEGVETPLGRLGLVNVDGMDVHALRSDSAPADIVIVPVGHELSSRRRRLLRELVDPASSLGVVLGSSFRIVVRPGSRRDEEADDGDWGTAVFDGGGRRLAGSTHGSSMVRITLPVCGAPAK